MYKKKKKKCRSTAFHPLCPKHTNVPSTPRCRQHLRLLRSVPQLARVLPTSLGWPLATACWRSRGDQPGQPPLPVLGCPCPLFIGEEQHHFPVCSWQTQCCLLSPDPGFHTACRNFLLLSIRPPLTSTKTLHGQPAQMQRHDCFGKLLLYLPGTAGAALPGSPVLSGLPNAWSYPKASSIWPPVL